MGRRTRATPFRALLDWWGLVACRTPCRSPQSNGLAEAFFGSLKRDDVYQSCLETVAEIERQAPGWIQDYNEVAPHSARGMRPPVQAYEAWVVKLRSTAVQN